MIVTDFFVLHSAP